MERQIRTHKGMKLIGIEVKTSNQLESDHTTAKIPTLHQKFLNEKIEQQIPNRIDDGDLYFAIYTNYENDPSGTYSLILASEVNSLEDVPEGMVAVNIPTAQYLVFTADGDSPAALARAWKDIWSYFSNNAPYKRTYTTDFEVYDKSFPDQVDVCIAVK